MSSVLPTSLPPYRALPVFPVDRHPARARARDGAYTPKPGKEPVRTETGKAPLAPSTPSADVTILRHCRCQDCIGFSGKAGQYVCVHDIGGTKITWATGQRQCDPPPDAWHHCSHYHGPQISTDVWVWRRSRQVGTGSNISAEVEPRPEDEELV